MSILFGNYLKTKRNEKNLTSAQVSKAAGISKTYYDYIERGEREPKLYVLAKIAGALGVSLNSLLEVKKRGNLNEALKKLDENPDGDSKETITAAIEAINSALNKNDDLQVIIRAGLLLDASSLSKMKGIMEVLYPELLRSENL